MPRSLGHANTPNLKQTSCLWCFCTSLFGVSVMTTPQPPLTEKNHTAQNETFINAPFNNKTNLKESTSTLSINALTSPFAPTPSTTQPIQVMVK